jgi:hypothetical protein
VVVVKMIKRPKRTPQVCEKCGQAKRAPTPPFLLLISKAAFIAFAYVLLHIWRPRLTSRQQAFVDIAAIEAHKRGWNMISIWSAVAIAAILSRIRATDPAYCAWFDSTTAEYERAKQRDNI